MKLIALLTLTCAIAIAGPATAGAATRWVALEVERSGGGRHGGDD